MTMENTGQLEPRVSVLDEEFNEAATLEVRGGGAVRVMPSSSCIIIVVIVAIIVIIPN